MLGYWLMTALVCVAGGWCCMKNIEFWQQALEDNDVGLMFISGTHSAICLLYLYVNIFWLLPMLKEIPA